MHCSLNHSVGHERRTAGQNRLVTEAFCRRPPFMPLRSIPSYLMNTVLKDFSAA
jgi:hypothetical protein